MKTVFPIDNVTEVVVTVNQTSAGNKAILLFDTEDGLPYAAATSHVPGAELGEDEVLVKNYSENTGILDFLVKNNIVKDTGKTVSSGFVELNVCTLNPQEVWGEFIHQ